MGETYRVLGDVNVFLLAELDQLWLEQPWVSLNLERCWGFASAVNERLQMLLGVVGHADSTRLLLGQLSHSLPSVDNGDIVEHLDVAIVRQREEVVVYIATLVEGDGEMHQVQIEVVEAQLSQTVVESTRHILGAMLRVP